MEIKYLENLHINSMRTFENFKRENVFNSGTLKEMFSPKYIYRGRKPDTVLVKSLKTGKPVEIYIKRDKGCEVYSYAYYFFDKAKNFVGEKYFSISDDNRMLTGYMSSMASELYSGIGIREEELQIKEALKHGIDYIPRSAVGGATLYHTKMGYLPVVNDLLEVKSENEVNRCMRGIKRKSQDLNPDNLVPIIIEKDGHYYIDVSTTQAVANVREIKQRLSSSDYTIKELEFLRLEGVGMSLSGEQFEYWKNLVEKSEASK